MNLLAAALHLAFWDLFDWPDALSQLSTVNSNIMQMLNLFITVFFIYVGLLLLFKPKMVVLSTIGRHFLGLLTMMWTARLAMEFYFPEGDMLFAGILAMSILFFSYPLVATLKVKGKMEATDHLNQPWLAHDLLTDFEIEDVWRLPVEMERHQTAEDFQKVFSQAIAGISQSGVAGMLFRFRFFLGRVFGWDSDVKVLEILPIGSIRERYASQSGLSEDDFSTPIHNQFVPVYQTKEEVLSEIENATVHAAVHFGRVAIDDDKYGVHMTVYVKPKGYFGKAYMQLIMPFRLFIVYPVLLKMIGAHWQTQSQLTASKTLALA